MELRIDRLLQQLQTREADIIEQIDRDPLLTKREVNGLYLANASKELFTPQIEHQLYAKGIVYAKEPYRLVSLPLLKIYNLGEKEVTMRDIEALAARAQVQYLRKFDGSMVQRFQHNGKVYFTTRGMIEGAYLAPGADHESGVSRAMFDYIGQAKQIARAQYPGLLEAHPAWEHLTFVMEFIHPEAQVITNYGSRTDLILLTVFDRRNYRYWTHAEVVALTAEHSFCPVDVLPTVGESIPEQIDSILAQLSGKDEEGTVVAIEDSQQVVYRVKIKTPDYLRLLKLMVSCNYRATVEMLDSLPTIPTWGEFRLFLQARGSEQVPEEVLVLYREYHAAFLAYLRDCAQVRQWAQATAEAILHGISETDQRLRRKAFAQVAKTKPFAELLFPAYDNRLDIKVIREVFPGPEEMKAALAKIG